MTPALHYNEGDLFAVPLEQGGFGVGLAARASRDGVIVGYFFGDQFCDPPSTMDLRHLRPEDAILIKAFGDLGLVRGEWPVIGRMPEWSRRDWPMPAFGREEPLSGRFLRVEYSDGDPNGQPLEEVVSEDEFRRLPEDGLAGFQFMQNRLSRLMASSR